METTNISELTSEQIIARAREIRRTAEDETTRTLLIWDYEEEVKAAQNKIENYKSEVGAIAEELHARWKNSGEMTFAPETGCYREHDDYAHEIWCEADDILNTLKEFEKALKEEEVA